MEDAIGEEPSVFPQLGIRENGRPIRLRADLDELYLLWKQRIGKRMPFPYIVGCEHWRDLVLSVEEGVLIPRLETKAIVDMLNDVILGNEGLREGLWADLGTGSGAISIGIGRILGNCGRVIAATDLSPWRLPLHRIMCRGMVCRAEDTVKSQDQLCFSIDRLTRELDQLLEDAPLPFIMQHAAKISGVRKGVTSLNSVLKSIQ